MTAKDDCSFVRNDFKYEVTVQEYASKSQNLMTREAARNLALSIELFETYLKNIFAAILCYDSSLALSLNIQLPTLIPSFDEMKAIVRQLDISCPPFNRRKINNSNIRMLLNKEYSSLLNSSTFDNQFNYNYSKLIDMLVVLRHIVTHNNFEVPVNSKKIDLNQVRVIINLDEGDKIILKPTFEQAGFIMDKIQEYAFMIFKELSKHYKLEYLSTSFSYKPELMILEENIHW